MEDGKAAAAMAGIKDSKSIGTAGAPAQSSAIDGVRVLDLRNVLTRSGLMVEVFRTDWAEIGITVRQVNWVQLAPGAVTDWHRHMLQTDHLVAVEGTVRLALWDDRPDSPTRGATQVIRMGILRPVLVIVPPGVFHALRNESGAPAGYLNVIDQAYVASDPDNWRLPSGSTEAPDIL